jgi:hypothetical protein
MIQRRHSASLAPKAFIEFFIGDLQRHQAVEPCIAGGVYLPHAAYAQQSLDVIRSELRSDGHARIIIDQFPKGLPCRLIDQGGRTVQVQ